MIRLKARKSDEKSTPNVCYVSPQTFAILEDSSLNPRTLVEIKNAHYVSYSYLYHNSTIAESNISIPDALCRFEYFIGEDVEVSSVDFGDFKICETVGIVFIGDPDIIERNKQFALNVFSAHDLPVQNGDIISIKVDDKIHGISDIKIKITDGCNDQFYRLADNVKISMPAVKKEGKKEEISYSSYIAGMDEQVKAVQSVVETQLASLPIFRKFGLKPSKGLLLIGPPGTGKTLLARTVAKLSNAQFFTKNASELFNEYAGAGERELRSLFDAAVKCEKAVIFIDEIDVITASRDHAQEDLTRRIVNQFLPLMDGMGENVNTIVMGATNRPHVIDPAFRRPGRFDRDVYMKIPKRHQRAEIFDLYLNRMGGLKDIDRNLLASLSEGYVGADIEGVCREVVLSHVENDHEINTDLFVSVLTVFVSARDRAFPMQNYKQGKDKVEVIEEAKLEGMKQTLQEEGGHIVEVDGLIHSSTSDIESFLSLSSTYYDDYSLFFHNANYLSEPDLLRVFRLIELVGYGIKKAYIVSNNQKLTETITQHLK